MSYYILRDAGSNFNDVDIAIDAIKLNHDVDIKQQIEILSDCYFVVADIKLRE